MEKRGFREVVNHLAVFRDIAEALNHANDVSGAMDAILPRLGEALGLQTAWAFRFDEHRRSFVEVGASGLPPALDCCSQAPLRTGWCECQSQFVGGELDEAVNIVRCSRLKSAKGDTNDLRVHASVPLRSKGKPLGILNLAAPGSAVFTNEALAFLQTVGQQVAVALDRARMFQLAREKSERLQRLAAMSAEWSGQLPPDRLLQQALEAYVEAFGYAVCGVVSGGAQADEGLDTDDDVVAVAEGKATGRLSAYVYPPHGDGGGPRETCRSILLSEAQSAISTPLPTTMYELRIESNSPYAFDDLDADLLQAFAWQLAAAYVGAQAHVQEMQHAHLVERHRIAAELHDSVSQRLFSAQLLVRTATVQMEGAHADALAAVERVGQLLAESQQEMRDLIRALRRIDESTSVLEELRARVRTLSMQRGPKVTLYLPDTPLREPALHVRAAVLAIVDEALHNALKHAGAGAIAVRLNGDATRFFVRIEDDGRGCQDSDIGTGLGTRSMFERAAALGGTLAILGRSGEGTCVELMVPYDVGEEWGR
ncbi:GAF domain-containing sensor histidine kinase [Alicyclobacillus fastidiosus]|uniref:histidine kinase n=1 Tax=Alicyclobacillus fastidiosus TaxID=392011 RepID=A0ABY6ZH15_9BACL|nr:GAF domain-containing sensor histidine kinase [Alicyclobacillus fastidiosus]WAH42132.1 GAF domain-containing sensor histidine kinase [Alicyclobacillus fastidiosus]GMA63914.1 hypothetical protein GCM10025859_43540 [Alicyclobacillus fastidiosus]